MMKENHSGIHLFVERYIDTSAARQAELDECLRKNLENTYFDTVWAFGEKRALASLRPHPRLQTVNAYRRMTFAGFFDEASTRVPGRICIIANSDIYFDNTLSLLFRIDLVRAAAVLTRWDIGKDGGLSFFNRPDSSDSWIFKSPLRISRASFFLGLPGCDNRMARLLRDAGRMVVNPGWSIRSYHLHMTGKRNYTRRDRVEGPYLDIYPTTLDEAINTINPKPPLPIIKQPLPIPVAVNTATKPRRGNFVTFRRVKPRRRIRRAVRRR